MIAAGRRPAGAAILFALTLALSPVSGLAQEAARGTGAILRGLDKVSTTTTDLEIATGEAVEYGHMTIRLGECRYPAADPNSDAFAQLVITDTASGRIVFEGWMVASSPAMSALDHARYDVWVMACVTE